MSRRNNHCYFVVPIYFDKKSDNEQDPPISPSQRNLTIKKITKRYKKLDTSTKLLQNAAKCGKMHSPKIKYEAI